MVDKYDDIIRIAKNNAKGEKSEFDINDHSQLIEFFKICFDSLQPPEFDIPVIWFCLGDECILSPDLNEADSSLYGEIGWLGINANFTFWSTVPCLVGGIGKKPFSCPNCLRSDDLIEYHLEEPDYAQFQRRAAQEGTMFRRSVINLLTYDLNKKNIYPSLKLTIGQGNDKLLRGVWIKDRAFIGLAGSSGNSKNPALYHGTTREKRNGDAMRFKEKYPNKKYFLLTTHLPEGLTLREEIDETYCISNEEDWRKFIDIIKSI